MLANLFLGLLGSLIAQLMDSSPAIGTDYNRSNDLSIPLWIRHKHFRPYTPIHIPCQHPRVKSEHARGKWF